MALALELELHRIATAATPMDTRVISAKHQPVHQPASIQAIAFHQTNATAHSLILVLSVKLNIAQKDANTEESALTLTTAFAIVLALGTLEMTALFLNAHKTAETRPAFFPICVPILPLPPSTSEATLPTATPETTSSPLTDAPL